QQQGITPIPPEEGIAQMLQLLRAPVVPTAVVVAGRYGRLPVSVSGPELPLLRFIEQPQVHVPGVELVVDSDLGGDTDPYLDDPVGGGERLFPAVLGLEAMAQAAAALLGAEAPPLFEDAAFLRPIAVPADGLRLRVCALVREPGV